MKRISFFILSVIVCSVMFVGCTKDSMIDDYGVANTEIIEISEKRNVRTVNEAEAKSFISAITKNLFNENPTLKSKNVVEDRAVEEMIPIVENEDTLLYIANYRDKSGYLIISADKVSFPVLGFSDKGVFDINNLDPNVQAWLDEAKARIANDITQPVDTTDSYNLWSNIIVNEDGEIQLDIVEEVGVKGDRTYSLSRPTVYPLTSTEWGQGYGYNYYCPTVSYPYYSSYYPSTKALAGCVAVAMGQVIKFWQYPAKWNYSAMPFKYADQSYNNVPNETAKMLKEIGTNVNMHYTHPNYLGSYVVENDLPKIVNTFRNYGYSNPGRLINYDFTQVYSSLQNRKPVIMLGTGSSGGHAWVAEGYYEMKIQVTETKKVLGIVISKKVYYIWRDYLYMNWGWNGSQDGWYENSSWVSSGNANFNSTKKVIVDIKR